MREIKFRGWHTKEKRMTKVFSFGDIDTGYLISAMCWVDDLEIMQYTGLRDVAGKKIFEGDIVRFGLDDQGMDRMGAVGYSFAEFTIISIARKYPDIRLSDATRLKVIGNIYQHPEFPGKEYKY